MVDTNELRGVIAKNGKSQTDVAKMLGISPKTFYLKMQKGVFGSDCLSFGSFSCLFDGMGQCASRS